MNINKQEEKSKEFKENGLKQIVKNNEDKEIFFNESRFGLIMERIWYKGNIENSIKV